MKLLIVALLGLVTLGCVLTDTEQTVGEIVHRLIWLTLTGGVLSVLFWVYHRRAELNARKALLLAVLIVVQMLITRWIINGLSITVCGFSISEEHLLLVLPYVLAPSMATAMMSRRIGVFATLSTTLFGMALMKHDATMTNYMVLSLVAGLLSSMLCEKMQKRAVIGISGIITGVAVFVAAVALGCLHWGENTLQNIIGFGVGFGAAVVVGVVICALLGGLMPHLERVFRITTHLKWLEMGDMNNKLIKELQLMAPGTFHHCLYTKMLAEDAAKEVGAYVTRVGICALYHDIGKIKNPTYFTENLQDQGDSPHLELTAEASARVIKQHVKDGVELAMKYKLDASVINIIREHHGKLFAGFFYRKALERYKEDKKKFDEGLIDTCPEEVKPEAYMYDGPIPQTRESGIVSMADAVESATRSLGKSNDEERRNIIEKLFRDRINDGHLRDSKLTLGEIDKIKETFIRTIARMNHSRISYGPVEKVEKTVPSATSAEVTQEADKKAS